jgi:hypothetical protein
MRSSKFAKALKERNVEKVLIIHDTAVAEAVDARQAYSSVGGLKDALGMQVRATQARITWGRQWRLVFLIGVVTCSLGCTSLLMPSGSSDRELQAMIDRNTRNLSHLQVDLFEEYVSDIMGPPQRVEGYLWGTVWFYRTALTRGARATPETDYTPLVFDQRGVLLGWGRDILASYNSRRTSPGEGPPQ